MAPRAQRLEIGTRVVGADRVLFNVVDFVGFVQCARALRARPFLLRGHLFFFGVGQPPSGFVGSAKVHPRRTNLGRTPASHDALQ